MNAHLDPDGQGAAAPPFHGGSFPSTPSPTSLYRRPSVVSSCSWENGLSSYSSEMSLQSPTTPQADDATSPHGLYIPDSQQLFPAIGTTDVPSLPGFPSSYPVGPERADPYPPKDFLISQLLNPPTFSGFDDMTMSSGPETTGASQQHPLYEVPSYKLEATPSFYDLSSSMDPWSSSPPQPGPAHGSTVMPAQILTGPRTPQGDGRHGSMGSLPGSAKSRSSEELLTYYPFTTPSPSVSASGELPGWSRPSTCAGNSSEPSTPTRRATRPKARSAVPKKWEPRYIYPKNEKKHKCRHPGCNGAFQRQEHLKRHETSHTGDRPHECRVAGCKFKGSRSDNLKQHMKRHRIRGGRVKYVPDLVID
ncbi:MAG: kruppel-like factor [Thelocarpon superellum]|nr:MAG: kruppel-like factor [Thelocarpon superellum]